MATFAEIQNRINQDYLNRTDLSAQTRRAIFGAIRNYERYRFWFNDTATAVVTSPGAAFLSVPSDFLILDELEITENSADWRLIQLSIREIRRINTTQERNLPTHFAYHRDRWELAVIPDQSYTVTIRYVFQLPALSADTDENEWTIAGQDLIAYRAASDVWMNVLRNPEQAMALKSWENEALLRLRAANEQRIYHAIRATKF